MADTSLMIQYPQDKYNNLIPVQTIQEMSPLHKLNINVVQLNADPEAKDVYQQKDAYKDKPAEFALTKKALTKLMAAANIQMVESKAVPTQKCEKCHQMAQATRLAPKCFECPYVDDVAYQVTIAVPEMSGNFRFVKATKELRMSDEKGRMTDAQYKQFYPFRTEQCESKALTRALRSALMISSTYKREELSKPFVVALVVPNMDDPDLKKAMVDRYTSSSAALFGGRSNTPQLEAGHNANVEIIDDRTIIDIGGEGNDDTPPWEQPLQSGDPACESCGTIIIASGNFAPEAIVDYSMKHFGMILCPDCQRTERAARKAGAR